VTYAELKAAVLAYAHRPDLTDDAAGFVRLAEGKLRRELLASTYTHTLDETDRVENGVYTLPAAALEVRSLAASSYALQQVSINMMRGADTEGTPALFAVIGDTIEIRGTPAADSEFTLEYFGSSTALSADEDTNDLLENHEALYLYAALFYLYQFTQDVELAQGALDTYTDTLEKLNEAATRKLGGAAVAGAYNFCSTPSY
jgi:hypothetical protein